MIQRFLDRSVAVRHTYRSPWEAEEGIGGSRAARTHPSTALKFAKDQNDLIDGALERSIETDLYSPTWWAAAAEINPTKGKP